MFTYLFIKIPVNTARNTKMNAPSNSPLCMLLHILVINNNFNRIFLQFYDIQIVQI